MRKALGACLALLASSALGADKLAVADFKGPNGDAVRRQIVNGVCEAITCVAEDKATREGKPDWKKAKKNHVDFIITGSVKAHGGKHTLELQLFKNNKRIIDTEVSFAGKVVPATQLNGAVNDLREAMGLSVPNAEPEAKK